MSAELTNSFNARDDAGNEYFVLEFLLDAASFGDPNAVAEQKTYRIQGNERVLIPLSDSEYRIAGTDTILHKV